MATVTGGGGIAAETSWFSAEMRLLVSSDTARPPRRHLSSSPQDGQKSEKEGAKYSHC